MFKIKLKYRQNAQIFVKTIRSILVVLILFCMLCPAHQVLADENLDARLRGIESKLKEIEASQNQIMTEQTAELEKIKTLKIWARHRGAGRAP